MKSKPTYKFSPLQEKWLKVLESGKYLRGTDQLGFQRTKSSPWRYCCLGVACVVAKVKRADDYDDYNPFLSATFDGETDYLPVSLYEKLRLRSQSGMLLNSVVIKNIDCDCLAKLNDNGWSHKKIARYIRAYPENVFVDA